MPIFHFIWSFKLSSYLAKRYQHNRATWMRIMFAPFLRAALTNLNKRESIRIWNSTESKMGLLISEKKQNIKVFLDTNWQNPFDAWKNSLSVPKKIRTWPPLKSYIEQMEKKKGKEGAFQRWHGGESSVQANWRAETTTSLPSFTFA